MLFSRIHFPNNSQKNLLFFAGFAREHWGGNACDHNDQNPHEGHEADRIAKEDHTHEFGNHNGRELQARRQQHIALTEGKRKGALRQSGADGHTNQIPNVVGVDRRKTTFEK